MNEWLIVCGDCDEPALDFLGGGTKNRLGTRKPKRFCKSINKKVKGYIMKVIIKVIKIRKRLTLGNVLTFLSHVTFSIIRIYVINSFAMCFW